MHVRLAIVAGMLTKEVMFYRVNDKNALDAMRKWGLQLQSELHEEAIETLKEENCVSEALYLLMAENQEFGMFIGVFKGKKKPPNMDREINQKHGRLFDEAFSNSVGPFPVFTEMECLYHLENGGQHHPIG
jgi:hypothetical protein